MVRPLRFAVVSFVLLFGELCRAVAQTPAKSHDYSQEEVVVESRAMEIAFANDGTDERKITFRARLQSEAGLQALGVIRIPYQKSTQSLEFDYVRVLKSDGTTVSTPADDPHDVEAEITRQAPLYSDLREKDIAVKGLGVGDVLEYQARWHTNRPLAPGQFWESYNFSRDEINLQDVLQISVPSDRPVKWKSAGYKPVIKEAGKLRLYIWTRAQLVHESSDEKKRELKRLVNQAVQGKLPQPDIQLSSFTNWEEVGAWYDTLQRDRVKPSTEVLAKAQELTKGMAEDDVKIRTLYRFVSSQFRYIGIDFGIGRYQPHAAADVLSNQFGDCKDKHTLLAALLGAIGIPAYPALVNSAHDIDPEVPSPAQFDHVVTVVPQGDHLTWLDTTLELAPFGYILSSLRDKTALVMPKEGRSSLLKTPGPPTLLPTESFRMDAKLSDTGTLEGKVERTIHGSDTELMVRLAFRRVPIQQWVELVQRLSFASGFAGEVSEVTTNSVEKTEEALRFNYHYLRKDYPDFTNKRIASPLPRIFLPSVPGKDAGQDEPIHLGPPAETRFESHVELPKGYRPGLPKKLDLVEDFAEYHSVYTYKDGVLINERCLLVKKEQLPVSVGETYRKFTDAVEASQDAMLPLAAGPISITSYQEEIWALPHSSNVAAAKAYDEAADNFRKGNFEGEVASLKHAVEVDPRYTRAWLWLGEIYKSRGQMELAIQAYRAAVKIDAEQPVSYKALGFALLKMSKYEEALPVWKELIRTAPDDGIGQFGLGSSLFGLKRCADAADAFDASVLAFPDLGSIQLALGAARLCAGQNEKALAAYRNAAELDPHAGTFNLIAYDLAQKNVELELALDYAKKAVFEESQSSQKVTLSSLEVKDLAGVLSLSAGWDTLGWVYFRLGQLDLAEEYLRAAWVLSQRGVIADHLGQLYEKQSKKQAAVHMYRLALKRFPKAFEDNEKTVERMERTVPGSSTSDRKTEVEDWDELSHMRTVKLTRLATRTVTAEFFLIFSEDPKTLLVRVEDVKYVSGSDELKSASAAIQAAKFHVLIPAEGHPRLLRRGILGCFPLSGCSFTMLNPEDVHSVN